MKQIVTGINNATRYFPVYWIISETVKSVVYKVKRLNRGSEDQSL